MKLKKKNYILELHFFSIWGEKKISKFLSAFLEYGKLNFLLSAKITEIFLSKCISIWP